MIRRGKEEAIHALTQSVDEISEPLEEYITSKNSDLTEFLDVSIGESKTSTTYDILLDSSHALNGDNKSNGHSLRKVLQDYGGCNNQDREWFCGQKPCRVFCGLTN